MSETLSFDIQQILKILPHRYPFLLVDRVTEMVPGEHVKAYKNLTFNEPFFQGHFPQEPVMPGVLIVEAMAQCGGILVLSNIPEPEKHSTYFLRIDNVRFKQKVVPGDTLQMEVQFVEPARRGMAVMQGKAFVGDKLVCEALMMAQISKNEE